MNAAALLQPEPIPGSSVIGRRWDSYGEPLIDGRPWTDPAVLAEVATAGPGACLVYNNGIERFDVLPLLIATDGAIAAFGRGSLLAIAPEHCDYRRTRP